MNNRPHNEFDPWYTSIRCLVNVFFRTFYRFRVFGRDNIPAGAAFMAVNHNSYYDPPLISIGSPVPVHFLADEFLFGNFLFRFFIKKLHAHPISGSVKDVKTFKVVKKLVNEGRKVVLFPEGGLSKTGKLQSFKPGLAMLALKTETTIVPTYIDGLFEAWPIQNLLPRFGHRITCVFGKPIALTKYLQLEKKEGIRLLTADVYQAIEDLRLWTAAQDQN